MTSVDPLVGRDLDGRYTIVDKLGGGAMGAVYRATQHGLGREVAIKVVTPRLGVDKVVIQRFLREAQLASKLAHPNAVAVLDFGKTQDDLIYLVMELVKGRTLEELVTAEGKLAAPRVVRIGSQICDALEGAHALKIVHRDLKPANIMLMSSGRDIVKVLDFGLAKSLESNTNVAMTTVGALLGTPAFMPPEAVTGGVVDGRADLYSLGCTLFFAAMGRIPFESVAVAEMIAMHAMEPPPPLIGVQVGLARVIERLLAKNPAERYADAAATRDALDESLSAGKDVVKPRSSTPRQGTMMGWATPAAGVPTTKPPTGPSPVVPGGPVVKLNPPKAGTGPTPTPSPALSTARPTQGAPVVANRATPVPPSAIAKSTPNTGVAPIAKPVAAPVRPADELPLPSPSSVVPAMGVPIVRADTEVDEVNSSWPTELAAPSPTPPPRAGIGVAAATPKPRTDLTPPPPTAKTPTHPAVSTLRPPDILQQRSRGAAIAWTVIVLVILASGGLVAYTLMMRESESSAAQAQDAAVQSPMATDAMPVDAQVETATPVDAAEAAVTVDAAVAPVVDIKSEDSAPPTKRPTKRDRKPTPPKQVPDKPVLRRTPGVGGN